MFETSLKQWRFLKTLVLCIHVDMKNAPFSIHADITTLSTHRCFIININATWSHRGLTPCVDPECHSRYRRTTTTTAFTRGWSGSLPVPFTRGRAAKKLPCASLHGVSLMHNIIHNLSLNWYLGSCWLNVKFDKRRKYKLLLYIYLFWGDEPQTKLKVSCLPTVARNQEVSLH